MFENDLARSAEGACDRLHKFSKVSVRAHVLYKDTIKNTFEDNIERGHVRLGTHIGTHILKSPCQSTLLPCEDTQITSSHRHITSSHRQITSLHRQITSSHRQITSSRGHLRARHLRAHVSVFYLIRNNTYKTRHTYGTIHTDTCVPMSRCCASSLIPNIGPRDMSHHHRDISHHQFDPQCWSYVHVYI